MVAAPVSPLERQQLESLRGPQATYWHRIRFELVGREAARAGAARASSTSAPEPACSATGWPPTHPELAYSFEEPSDVLRDSLVRRFGDAAEVDPDAPIPDGTLVAMLDVLEHIADDAAALARALGADGARHARW